MQKEKKMKKKTVFRFLETYTQIINNAFNQGALMKNRHVLIELLLTVFSNLVSWDFGWFHKYFNLVSMHKQQI